MCCINIRNFVDQFYQFVEGVPHRRAGIDEVLRRVSSGSPQIRLLKLNH